jgi:hypothetical protein
MECFKEYGIRCDRCGIDYILSFNFDDLNNWLLSGGDLVDHINYLNKLELNLIEYNDCLGLCDNS